MRKPIRSAVLLLVTAACAGTDAAGPDPRAGSDNDLLAPPGVAGRSITVMSRNLYFGAALDELFAPGVDFGQAALEVWATIQHTSFPARANAIADEVARVRPHFIGLQEAVTYTVLAPDFQVVAQLSHVQLLLQALAARGLDYHIAVFTPHTTATAPVGDLQNPAFYVNFLDAEAILVRGDVQVTGADAGIYAAGVPVPPPFNITIRHAWQTVDAAFDEANVRFANTHLETQDVVPVQVAQTAELIQALAGSPYPVILVGDFNSAANRSAPADRKTPTYDMLIDAGFVDVWTRSAPADKGLTCCHAPDLSNETLVFDQRLDLVFMRNLENGRGFAGGTALDVVGEELTDRFATGLGYDLWPSDHAGIAASVWLPPGHAGN